MPHRPPAARRSRSAARAYPVVLPKLSDPRLHLAAVIISLQVIGQVAFHFRLSIAQILLALGTCAVLEVAIAMRKQHVLIWPASAMLTGNGVAFILRVPGHGARRLVEPARLVDLRRHRGGLAALEVRDQVARRPHLQPVEHRPRPLLPAPRTRPGPSRSTSGGGRCRRGSASRSRDRRRRPRDPLAAEAAAGRRRLLGLVRRRHRRARRWPATR